MSTLNLSPFINPLLIYVNPKLTVSTVSYVNSLMYDCRVSLYLCATSHPLFSRADDAEKLNDYLEDGSKAAPIISYSLILRVNHRTCFIYTTEPKE